MNKRKIKEWVEVLRSGKYQQGQGRLRGSRGYCCLGVLCDITPEVKWDIGDHAVYKGSSNRLFLPRPLEIEVFGNNNDLLPIIDRGGVVGMSLGSLNDQGFTFSQIADLIEFFYLKG